MSLSRQDRRRRFGAHEKADTPPAQQGPIANAAGGLTVDAEARAALNALLAAMRAYGLLKP